MALDYELALAEKRRLEAAEERERIEWAILPAVEGFHKAIAVRIAG